MKKLVIFTIIALVAFAWVRGTVRDGRFERFMERHDGKRYVAACYYYTGLLYALVNQNDEAAKYFARVMQKYPQTRYMPLAWAEKIELMSEGATNNAVVAESRSFLEKYPDHPSAKVIERKIRVIEQGY